MQRLIDESYIEGFRAILNPAELGLDQVAFVEFKLYDTKEKALAEFNMVIKKILKVEERHMIACRFDYLLKVRTSDSRKYRQVLGDNISSLPYVASTSTSVAMESVKESGR